MPSGDGRLDRSPPARKSLCRRPLRRSTIRRCEVQSSGAPHIITIVGVRPAGRGSETAMSVRFADLVREASRELSLRELLEQPVTELIGVSADAASALSSLTVGSICWRCDLQGPRRDDRCGGGRERHRPARDDRARRQSMIPRRPRARSTSKRRAPVARAVLPTQPSPVAASGRVPGGAC